jgi:asparagine synthase (glutamine-hydrolysing)
MCGIAGLLQFDNQSGARERTLLLTRALSHRGPDDEAVVVRGPAILGHRRLSIIDLQGGRQPLANEDESIWITCNGEIYNYRELRDELQHHGHSFRTRSDTEVIVHAYEEWGDSCVEHFRGMFAFAILDERRHRLFLARDHFGIKPLYYVHTSTFFAFASELQSLRLLPDVSWDLDLQAMDQYLALQYIPAPGTIYGAANKLPPACRMSVSFDGRVSQPEQYWRLRFMPNEKRSEVDTLAELDSVLRESVNAHLMADVPFGAFLSGGVDSSTVVAYMSELLGRPVKTFSIGFDEADYSELNFARQVSHVCGTEHHEEIVRPDALGILPALVHHYGEPFGDNSAIPTFYVSRLARGEVPMVLSGDGGDECFAGYEDTYMPWMRHLALTGAGVPTRARSVEDYMPFVSSSPRWREAMWLPERGVTCAAVPPVFQAEFTNARDWPGCSQAQYIDLKTYLPNSVLTKVDIASMMHGLEVRTPILDTRVVEFAATIPVSYNVKLTADEWVGKRMLKGIASRWFSREFVDRPKQGFGLPLARWLGDAGAVTLAARERCQDSTSPLREYFKVDQINDVIQRRSENLIWRLLVLDEWLRQDAHRPSSTS